MSNAPQLWQTVQDNDARIAMQELANALKAANDTITTLQSQAFVPSGGIILYLGAACPTGYTEVTAMRNNFPMGNPAGGTVGATGGNASHTHGVSAITVGGSNNNAIIQPGTGTGVSLPTATHNHILGGTTDAAAPLPPYVQTLFCQKA